MQAASDFITASSCDMSKISACERPVEGRGRGQRGDEQGDRGEAEQHGEPPGVVRGYASANGVNMLRTILTLATLLTALLSPGSAQDQPDGFRSPSSNIHCQAFRQDDGAALRCDIRATSNRPPARPRDCELDWGRAFEVSDKARPAARLCHGDTVMDDALPPLAYGASWQRHGFTCRSEQSGIACRNARGNGFELSRGRQRVF